nr:integrase, catalytic region, zinc finger, CCHC-type, peptidase aspartic, catalytic [Tanacetum cinerariifolium]
MMNELIRNQCKSQELKTVSYHKLYDILKQHQHEVNKIRAEKIARVANPLALFAQQQPVYHPQHHPTQLTQNSLTRSQQAATRNKEKAIVNSPQPIYDQKPPMVDEDDETSKDKEIDKLMALISLSFKKIYKPTNNNLRTSLNTSRVNPDNSPSINRNDGYENQRNGNIAGARETVGSTVVQKSGIQCYNNKEFGHVARECQKPKRAKDAAYHREKMLLEEIDQNDDDNDLAKERELLASLIEKLKCEIDESKNRNKFLETSNKALIEKLKGVIPTTSVSRPQLKSNPQGDRVLYNNSQGKKLEVEDHRRSVKLSKNKTSVTAFASESNKKPRNFTRKLYERVSKTCSWWYPKFTPSGYIWKPKSEKENVNPNLVEIVLFIVDSGCSKHMMGNLKLLINFVEKFLGTVKFGNDQIAPILRYEDLVQGAVTIKRVYYVKGLNHNLFSIVPTLAPTVLSSENTNQAKTYADNDQVTDDEFINIFSTPVQDQGETSSCHVDSSNMHTFYQRYPSEHRWTKDHPLEQVIGNPSQSVRTRRQLESDAEMCMFALT